MQEIKLNDSVTIKCYTDADEMPLNRYMAFQKYLLMDSGVGCDMRAVSEHFQRFHQYLAGGMYAEAGKEAENLHFNMFSILERINFQALAFGCRVYAINDEILTDYSEDALLILSERFNEMGLTQGVVKESNDDSKKKIFEALKRYYPEFFPDDVQTEVFVRICRRLELVALLIEEEGDEAQINAEIEEIDAYILGLDKPQSFAPEDPENASLKMDLSYMNLVSMMEGNGIHNAAMLPVLSFYARLSYLKKQTAPAATHK